MDDPSSLSMRDISTDWKSAFKIVKYLEVCGILNAVFPSEVSESFCQHLGSSERFQSMLCSDEIGPHSSWKLRLRAYIWDGVQQAMHGASLLDVCCVMFSESFRVLDVFPCLGEDDEVFTSFCHLIVRQDDDSSFRGLLGDTDVVSMKNLLNLKDGKSSDFCDRIEVATTASLDLGEVGAVSRKRKDKDGVRARRELRSLMPDHKPSRKWVTFDFDVFA
jgi:hypothetical protein